jgi:hypothetical protein
MRYPLRITLLALAATALLMGCRSGQQAGDTGNNAAASYAHVTMPSGTSLDVALGTRLTSETASVGDTWTGSVVNGREGVPAGSEVGGMVTAVTAAHKGDRAMLRLGLNSLTVAGRSYPVSGSMDAIVAASTRSRNLGAIGASTVAGALVGGAAGGSGKGALVGAVVGGGAATGVVSQTKGWQVVLKEGATVTFTTHESVAVRI